MMRKNGWFAGWYPAALIVAALAVGCGGGDDDLAGSKSDLNISPKEFTFTFGGATCVPITGPTVQIIGGAPPYNIHNGLPQAIGLSTNKVDSQEGTFVVTFTSNICVSGELITITDQLGRQISLTLNTSAS